MHYQKFALLVIALASVSASPVKISKRDWVNDEKGNLKIAFSDQKIQLGSISVQDIIDKLATACSTQGQCDTDPIEIKGELVSKDSVNGETLTVNPSGAYPTWIHNGLIDALHAAVDAVAECEDVTNQPLCNGPERPERNCPLPPPITKNECKVPQYWGINYQPPGSGDNAPPYIGADMSIKLDDDGFCEKFAEIGAAIAGAVNGVAGGIFTLSSLFCGKF